MKPPPRRPHLPALLRAIADDFGDRTALRFAREHGGSYLHLPASAQAEHPIAKAFGLRLLTWLIERHAHLERIVVPKGPNTEREAQRAKLRRLIAAGHPASDIAARLGLHVRTVHAWKRRLRDAAAAQPRATRREKSP